MRKLNYKLMSLAVVAMAFTACEEDGLGGTGEIEASIGEMYVNAESTVSQMYKNVDEALRTFDFAANPSVAITIDGASFDRHPTETDKYVLDYGNGVATRGKTIAGSLEISMTGGTDYNVAGTQASVALMNYTENDKPVSGSFVAENMGSDKYSLDIANFSVQDNTSDDDGGPKTLTIVNSNKLMTWTSGSGTPSDVSDDAYTIDGNGANGADDISAVYDGDYNVAINFLQPMKLDNTCTYRLLEGELELTLSTSLDPNPLAFDKAVIDFITGDGSNSDGCDNFFEIDLENTDTQAKLNTTRQFNGF